MPINEKIVNALQVASLTEAEMKLWKDTLEHLSEQMKNDIFEAFSARPDGVRLLTDNLVAKVEALKSGDIQQWEKVLEGDKAIISNPS